MVLRVRVCACACRGGAVVYGGALTQGVRFAQDRGSMVGKAGLSRN